MTTIPQGATLRENRQGAEKLTVLSHVGNIIETYEGVRLHVTKVRDVETDDGYFVRHWIDKRVKNGRRYETVAHQVWMFIPKK